MARAQAGLEPAGEVENRAAIVGGGPAGLTQARVLRTLGVPFTLFERNADFGGLWNRDDPASPIYDSAHLISSRSMTGFDGFPMPGHWPDYPGGRLVLEYIRDFARANDLYAGARFQEKVTRAQPVAGGWRIETDKGGPQTFRWLIAANGSNWVAHMPQWPGEFLGDLRHSSSFKRAQELSGQRVLIVGLGNSGVDIACEATHTARSVAVSVRRGYHVIPKHILGKPADVFSASGPPLPKALRQWVFQRLLRLLLGDLQKYGMPRPDHKLLETHPLLNDQLVHHLHHGDIEILPDIKGFNGDEVQFSDGSTRAFDTVICATGFDWEIPYIAPDLLEWSRGRIAPTLAIFPAVDNLFLLSFVESNGSSFSLFNAMSQVIGRAICDEWQQPARYQRLRQLLAAEKFDVTGGLHMVDSDRHVGYMDNASYRKALARLTRQIGWPKQESFAPPSKLA